jgi:hypothetical protein
VQLYTNVASGFYPSGRDPSVQLLVYFGKPRGRPRRHLKVLIDWNVLEKTLGTAATPSLNFIFDDGDDKIAFFILMEREITEDPSHTIFEWAPLFELCAGAPRDDPERLGVRLPKSINCVEGESIRNIDST